jgi:uncharacterized membrane protein YadS
MTKINRKTKLELLTVGVVILAIVLGIISGQLSHDHKKTLDKTVNHSRHT